MNRRIKPLTAVTRRPAAATGIQYYNSPAWLVRIADFIRMFFPAGQAPIDEKFY
ncbi:MAG: hypothetical protein HZB26_17260 [Candidatus Hydrogenedentes bacterium]|nr:hypothetical protein [Candidatus Hydrogenedentota bacterium]